MKEKKIPLTKEIIKLIEETEPFSIFLLSAS